MINLHDLPIFAQQPVMKSFTGYVLSDFVPRGLPTQKFAFFQSIEQPFAYDIARHVLVLSNGIQQLEFYIVCKGNSKEPKLMAFRTLTEGEIDENSLGFVHYEYQPHDRELISEALMSLPMQEAKPINMPCHCPKN